MATVMAGRRPVSAATPPEAVWSHTLWRPEDFMRWVISIGAGGIVLVVSWYVCAGDASFYRQIGPLDAAVAGLILAGLGNAMWLLRGRRNIGERRRALLPDMAVARAIDEAVGELRELAVGPGVGVSADLRAEQRLLVAGDGLARFHRPGCALAAGRNWTGANRQAHLDLGRQPCGVCRP